MCDIRTNVFKIDAQPLWKQIQMHNLFYTYIFVIFYTSYLTKVIKFVTQKMQYILDKYKIEQIESFEGMKRLGIALFNAQQMLI
jgi:hypothetical protein